MKRVADATTVPFTVGGGIADVATAAAVLEAGATKISTSSAAFRQPAVIAEMVKEFGAERVTVAIDVDQNAALPSGYEVYIDGGRTATGTDAIEWAKRVDGYGVGCILPTSKAGDGARTGYDLPLIRGIAGAVSAPVVASGGAGTLSHFAEAVAAGASILLAASVFHFGLISIPELKEHLRPGSRRIGTSPLLCSSGSLGLPSLPGLPDGHASGSARPCPAFAAASGGVTTPRERRALPPTPFPGIPWSRSRIRRWILLSSST